MESTQTATPARSWRELWNHRQQLHRHILSLLAAFHATTLLPAMVSGYITYHKFPSFLECTALILSIAARNIWIPLFRDPESCFGHKRQSKEYKLTIYAVAGLTTLPNAVVHLMMLMRAGSVGDFYVPRVLVSMALWGLAAAMCLYMVWRWLIDEYDGIFEPIVNVAAMGLETRNEVGQVAEPYSDEPAGEARVSGCELSDAYTLQQSRSRVPADGPSPEDDVDGTAEQAEQEEETTATAMLTTSPTTTLRCPTVARFDYMPQNHIGFHSYLSYPLIPTILFIYSTYMAILIIVLVYEHAHSLVGSWWVPAPSLYTVASSTS